MGRYDKKIKMVFDYIEKLETTYYLKWLILSGGIHFFDTLEKEIKLRLMKTRSYNEITDLVYERRRIMG